MNTVLTLRLKYFLGALITLGLCARLYDFRAPWKTHDHYNFGGVWTTAYAECLKVTPLTISHGIPHTGCYEGKPQYYPAHEPTQLFAMWGWTAIFGSSEASYRLFVFFFSALNVFLIFKIARLARPELLFAWLAAVFQSGFLAGIYFGTHPDFINEFTVFFVLLCAWLAMRKKMTLAALASFAAGLASWPGAISFGPLWLYALLIKKGRKRIFLLAVLSFAIALGIMMWLHQTTNILTFLHTKLVTPGYIDRKQKGWLEPLYFVMNFITSQSRLLSPLFCVFAFFLFVRREGRLFVTDARRRWASLTPFHSALLLSGGTGLLYAVIGHEYLMVHVFLYLLLVPAMSLACARGFEHLVSQESLSPADRWTLACLGVLFVACYPFGIFQSNRVHDVVNSVFLIAAVLILLIALARGPRVSVRLLWALLVLGVVTNISQMINYRNEPDTERSFCQAAREEFSRTGLPVKTKGERSDAKDLLYCRGVPIEYLHQ